jgi:polysaccharide export outer membrane protein
MAEHLPDIRGCMRLMKAAIAIVVSSAAISLALAQSPAPAAGTTTMPAVSGIENKGASYILGAGDLILVHASNVPELADKPFRIDLNGIVNLPVAGRLQATGLTVQELEGEVAKRLRIFLEEPDVAISVSEFQSQPVSIFGEVGTPGVHQLQGRKTLIELLSLAGGVKAEAGPTVRITRRMEFGRIPLPGATDDASGKFNVAELDLKPLVAAKTPEKDIQIQPYDVISVPKAEFVYVAGDVTKSGSLVLADKRSMSIMEALSSSGGVTKTSEPKKARILRTLPGTAIRSQVPVDIARIMNGKSSDIDLLAGDILFVPSSNAKKVTLRALEAAIQAGTVILSSGVVNGTI